MLTPRAQCLNLTFSACLVANRKDLRKDDCDSKDAFLLAWCWLLFKRMIWA
jgi:hypothetical protein